MSSGGYSAANVADNARSGNDNYCYGYGNVDTKGYYITTVKLETGKVSIKGLGKDEVLEGIVAYDRAERNGAYIGQINMITVSSFAGPNSAIWGYDIAKISDLRSDKLYDIQSDDTCIPVYSMDHLLKATETLFGTEKSRFFPPLAGAHVPCAAKSANSNDPSTGEPTSGWVWSYLSLAIAQNRERDACLFVEDAGFFADDFTYGKVKQLDEQEVIAKLDKKTHQVTRSQMLCGKNQSVAFKEIFVSYRYLRVNQDHYGTAFTCAPYITLAENAYPSGGGSELASMSLDEWKESVTKQPRAREQQQHRRPPKK